MLYLCMEIVNNINMTAMQLQLNSILKRITALLKDIEQHPFSGIGKPEPLKGENGKWSRMITDEHCLVYSIHFR